MTETINCPNWINFLTEATGGDPTAIQQLQEFARSCLDMESPWGKALILTGQGFGKTTFLKILKQIVGSDKTSYLPLSDFGKDHHRYELKGKALNISPLECTNDLNNGNFKAIFAGDSITAINNYGIPISFSPNCKLAFETNTHLKETRRCLCVHFNHQPETPNQNLTKTLMGEISAIRLWAEKGRANFNSQDCLTAQIETPSEAAGIEDKETIEIDIHLIKKLWECATRAKLYFDHVPPKSIDFMEKDHEALSQTLKELFNKHLSTKALQRRVLPKISNADLLLKEVQTINKNLQALISQENVPAIGKESRL